MDLFTYKSTEFYQRHIGPSESETAEMLQLLNVPDIDTLIDQTVPPNIRRKDSMGIPAALCENDVLELLKDKASKNKVFRSLIGFGYYDTLTPGVILRNIMENPGWYTQYTPYQAEIAQGRLEALLNFQTMVTDLTGMEISNASLLDEGTAASESMRMFFGLKSDASGNKFFVSENCFPQTKAILVSTAEPLGIEIEFGDEKTFVPSENYFGMLLQYPDQFGNIHDYKKLVEAAHAQNLLVSVAADIMSLLVLPSPGSWGADVVVGTTQRFGVPIGFGGPHAAYFATKDAYKRSLPGRIIGVSIDAHGKQALRMALQTREQHIRREKATSNICTAQVLLAVMASMYACYHGPKGLQNIAASIHAHAQLLFNTLKGYGLTPKSNTFFDTISFEITESQKTEIEKTALSKKFNFNWFNPGVVTIALDERTTLHEVNQIAEIFALGLKKDVIDANTFTQTVNTSVAAALAEPTYLQHPVFNQYHSEHEMLRYIKSLEAKDLSLTHSMIALGSCTMKLNATTEMIPVTWEAFNSLHPFIPQDQAAGYHEIFDELSTYLASITGFKGVSLQPNSGAQGEYAGLMVIRDYLSHIGQGHRNIALIPSSAHGTNPASAVLAGMKVVVTKCDKYGNIDIEDLRLNAEKHADNLACLMITYPSTHGVFEEGVLEICSIIHAHGGQVYMDGANMNAQVGLTSPGLIKADVCHLNLHKTFCIPHGGGGPGMGPICVAEHLVDFLPNHSLVQTGGKFGKQSISAAPFGSASILLISYAYIRLLGAEGLTKATMYAILNANYIKARLKPTFPVLYTGKNGRCAHEMIIDMRGFKMRTGIEVEDIAKRLIDYGFHAPTVSFPVAGTLMIEPTESESKAELDRFCDALLSIRKEIADIENGTADKASNVLKNAPHTAEIVTSDDWNYPYTRKSAAYPLPWVKDHKFWPSVGRVNSTYGDRNLVCSCPPVSDYETEAV